MDTLRRIVFFGAGLVLMLFSLLEAAGTRQFTRRAVATTGIVTRTPFGGSHPDIRFTTRAGETIEYPQNGMIGGYSAGNRVTVLYNPQNPRQAQVNSWGALWGFTLMTFLMGAVFTTAAVAMKPQPT